MKEVFDFDRLDPPSVPLSHYRIHCFDAPMLPLRSHRSRIQDTANVLCKQTSIRSAARLDAHT